MTTFYSCIIYFRLQSVSTGTICVKKQTNDQNIIRWMKRKLPTEENYFQTLLFFGTFLKIPGNVSGPKPNKTFSNENVKNTKKRKLMKPRS